MYLFRATGDHAYLQFGLDALESIETVARTPCGYASVRSEGCVTGLTVQTEMTQL